MGSYAPPVILSTGLTIPTYAEILADLLSSYQTIYGSTVYLGIDAADYQWISAVALKVNDVFQALQLVYNNRGPLTAVGAALDGIVKLNGLVRTPATPSTANVAITGIAGTVITNGVVQDTHGIYWDLPASVAIPSGGTITTSVTCETPGAISVAAGAISKIATPQAGWTGVTNAAAGFVGQLVESDSHLRARQSLSVALPSRTTLAGTIAGIAAVPGVTRYNVLENPTGSTDSYGNPPHSITAVVEGGTELAVATAIFENRGIGAFTNGTTTVVVTDPVTGLSMNISFYLPTYVAIFVAITVAPLAGYTSATKLAIQAALVAYLNSLQIGENVTISALYGAALSVMPNLSLPLFSITQLKAGTTLGGEGTTDLALLFYQVAQGIAADVVVSP